jgi:glucose uptake protein GlcU
LVGLLQKLLEVAAVEEVEVVVHVIAEFLALAVMVTGIVVIFKQHKENEVTEENKAKAEKLFRKAAEQGHGGAIEWLEENAKEEKGE